MSEKSYPAPHRGRPGKRGGSAPRGGGGGDESSSSSAGPKATSTPEERRATIDKYRERNNFEGQNEKYEFGGPDYLRGKDAPEQKHAIVSMLADKAGIPYNHAYAVIRAWASNKRSTIEKAVAKKFGIELSDYHKALVDLDPSAIPEIVPEDEMKRAVDVLYDETQKWFKDAGIKHVKLYRGVKVSKDVFDQLELGNTYPTNSNALSSWTLDPGDAKRFTTFTFSGKGNPVVLEQTFPVEQIFSNARTGLGALNESEFVVIGSPDSTARVIGKAGSYYDPIKFVDDFDEWEEGHI